VRAQRNISRRAAASGVDSRPGQREMLPGGPIVTATITPDRPVQWVRPAPATAVRHRIMTTLVTVCRAHFEPLRESVRSHGLTRAVPASLALATASLMLTALVHTPSRIQHQATSLLEYK